jgi:hypothetical protein
MKGLATRCTEAALGVPHGHGLPFSFPECRRAIHDRASGIEVS